LPILVNNSSGQPLYHTTMYTMAKLRAKNQSTGTIEQSLRAITIFLIFLDSHEINFIERLKNGTILDLCEIDEITRLCKIPMKKINEMFQNDTNRTTRNNTKSLEQYRMSLNLHKENEICGHTVSIRIIRIRDYILWITNEVLLSIDPKNNAYMPLLSKKNIVLSSMNAKIPSSRGKSTAEPREGLSHNYQTRLLEVIAPEAKENPWISDHVRKRNELMVLYLYLHGLRRGELLNIKISDIDFRKNEILIARRSDDSEDPRLNQPKVKTLARKLMISDNLAEKTKKYIQKERKNIPGSKKHPFLFVSEIKGTPLSLNALNKVFRILRKKVEAFPSNLSPHVLRHTWNDIFSERMEEKKITEEKEKKIRSYLMGWSPTSDTAATYTRRYVRKKAQEVSLEMQRKLIKDSINDK